MKLHPAALAALLAATHCRNTPSPARPAPVTASDHPPASPATSPDVPPAPAARLGPDAAPQGSPAADATDDELRAAATGINALAADLYGRVRATPGNVAFSPASVAVAFGMATAGARGETLAEMRRVLRYGLDDERLHTALGTLGRRWNVPAGSPVEMAVANRLYGHQGYGFVPGYLTRTAQEYGAPMETVDYGQPEVVRGRINQWVATQTRDRIRDLIARGGVTEQTRLVLVNAMYFKGTWLTPFQRSLTRDEPFTTDGAGRPSVPMMRQTEYRPYASHEGAQVLELPYRGNTTSMVLILPERPDGLGALEARLNAQTLDRLLSGLGPTRVAAVLPRFTIDPPQAMQLAATFQAMGMRRAFDRAQADFTGMASPPSPDDRLYISQVFHKTFVEVNEEGTEAAAATAITMARTGGAPPSAQPVEFRADRPFLFVIRDRATGAVLFMGRVSDPRGPRPS